MDGEKRANIQAYEENTERRLEAKIYVNRETKTNDFVSFEVINKIRKIRTLTQWYEHSYNNMHSANICCVHIKYSIMVGNIIFSQFADVK